MAKRSQRKMEGWKSKQWFNVIAPDFMGQQVVGETPASDPELLLGRVIAITLGDFTNDMSKQNVKMELKVDQVGGDSAYTKFIGHKLTRDYLRSLVKRQTSMIVSNIDVMTNDGYKVRVKSTCFTIKRARTSQIKSIRQLMSYLVRRKARESDFATFIQDAVTGKLSARIYRDVKNIYPLRRVEILKTQVLSEPEGASVPRVEEPEEVEPDIEPDDESGVEPDEGFEVETESEPDTQVEDTVKIEPDTETEAESAAA